MLGVFRTSAARLLVKLGQVFIYSVANWNTPHILDTRGGASLIVQSETHFLTLDAAQGVQVSSRPTQKSVSIDTSKTFAVRLR